MSIVMNSNIYNKTNSNNDFIANSISIFSQEDWGKKNNDNKLFVEGEIKYKLEYAKAIILLEMVRGLRWKPASGAEELLNCPAGMTFIIPAQMECAIVWPKSTAHLAITLDEKSLEADANTAVSHPQWIPTYFVDKQCLQLAQILWSELQLESDISNAYIDAFRTVLTGVLIRNAVVAKGGNKQQFGLSNYATRQVEQYLKENFRQPVSVPDMASLVGISAGHFATCFRVSFGLTPHQYLMRLRLDEAERCLRETDIPLSEIAASLGFSSQSHMTTALRKYRHLTPGELRRRSYAQRQKNEV